MADWVEPGPVFSEGDFRRQAEGSRSWNLCRHLFHLGLDRSNSLSRSIWWHIFFWDGGQMQGNSSIVPHLGFSQETPVSADRPLLGEDSEPSAVEALPLGYVGHFAPMLYGPD